VLCCTAVFPHNKFLCNIVSGTAVGWFLKLPSILAVSCSRERSWRSIFTVMWFVFPNSLSNFSHFILSPKFTSNLQSTFRVFSHPPQKCAPLLTFARYLLVPLSFTNAVNNCSFLNLWFFGLGNQFNVKQGKRHNFLLDEFWRYVKIRMSSALNKIQLEELNYQ